ncbi:MAG: hypothetical protein NWF09_09875 [Candidatus Bathyarchaeota archaeon]|nr:hypothetical protein [Candidatus Bathyarchaeota archaeon]
MPNIKLKINLVDKRKIFPIKAQYDPETRIATAKRSLRQNFPSKFIIDPDHIYQQQTKRNKFEFVCYVDVATRQSIDTLEAHVIHSEKPINGNIKNTLDYLIEEKFWKSIIQKAKLPLSTVLIMLFAGCGIFYVIREILLPIFGVK